MTLLSEYALTPDVFDITCYNTDEVCGLQLQSIKDILLQEGVVRNLCDGDWARVFEDNYRPWHQKGKELVKKLAIQNRLIKHKAISPTTPNTDIEWCNEAIATHKIIPLHGIIVTESIAPNYTDHPLVAPIHKLSTTPWWADRSPSIRTRRTLGAYKENLFHILKYSNSIMFIDAHIDPGRHQYKNFIGLLEEVGNRIPAPLIEIHRVCYHGSGPSRKILNPIDIEDTFRRELSDKLKAAGLQIKVFIWDDFHDRYLISDLIGISLQNGFDTSNAPNAITTWTRLGRKDKDDIQREFDPSANRHKLHHRFSVP